MPKPKNSKSRASKPSRSIKSASKSTMGGPSTSASRAAASAADAASVKFAGTATLAASFKLNPNKALEYDREAAVRPPTGVTSPLPNPLVGASTLTERNVTPKTGEPPAEGFNPTVLPLTRVRVDSSGQALTTNQGVQVG